MSPLIQHLGLALLGHYDIIRADLPRNLRAVSYAYQNDPGLFPRLCAHADLREYLTFNEIHLDTTPLAGASLIAISHMFIGPCKRADLIHILTHPVSRTNTLLRLNKVLNIKVISGDLAQEAKNSLFQQKNILQNLRPRLS